MTRFSRLLLLLFSFALLTDTLLAQPGRGGRPMGGTISGVVVSSTSGEGLPGATIALWNGSDSTLVTGMAADVNGAFTLENMRPGSYYLKISSLGFLTLRVPDVVLKPGAMNADLGSIALVEDPDMGDEVVVVEGERSEVEFRSDRTVYNVEDQAISTGGNAIDVLRNVPQVEVDIDENISLRGSNNVAVQVNGRPMPITGEALAAFLKSLPAEMVVKIEVIPNPSAKYDPEGMAGIINIVLKEKEDNGGVSGNLSLTGGLPAQASGSASLNARGSKLNLFSSYSFRYSERHSGGVTFRENRYPGFEINYLDQESDGDRIRRSHSLNATLDYIMTPTHSLSVNTSGNYQNGASTDQILYNIWEIGNLDTTSTIRSTPGEGEDVNLDFGLSHRWKKKEGVDEWTTELRYYSNLDEERGDYAERLRGEFSGDSLTARQKSAYDRFNFGVLAQSDYVRGLGEAGRLEAGYRGELRTIENGVYSETLNPLSGSFEPDVELNNEFVYDENIQAIYGLYNHTFGKLDAQIGLRGEIVATDFNLLTTDTTFENDYTSLYPSAAASYSLSQRTRLRASASRRVNRPGVWRLNPFPRYEDRLNRRTGNPFLRPEYTNSFELGINHFSDWGTINFSPFFRHTTDLIERWLTVDSNGVSTVSWENFSSSNTYGADIVTTVRIGRAFRGFTSVNLYQIDLDGSNIDSELTNNAFGWSLSANGSFTPLKWLTLQSNWFYRAPIRINGGEIDAFTSLGAAIKTTFLDDRASLTFRVSDIFNTMKFNLYRSDSTYYVDLQRNWQSQGATLTFSWDFGSRDSQPQQRRRRSSGDESGGGGSPAGMGF